TADQAHEVENVPRVIWCPPLTVPDVPASPFVDEPNPVDIARREDPCEIVPLGRWFESSPEPAQIMNAPTLIQRPHRLIVSGAAKPAMPRSRRLDGRWARCG